MLDAGCLTLREGEIQIESSVEICKLQIVAVTWQIETRSDSVLSQITLELFYLFTPLFVTLRKEVTDFYCQRFLMHPFASYVINSVF